MRVFRKIPIIYSGLPLKAPLELLPKRGVLTGQGGFKWSSARGGFTWSQARGSYKWSKAFWAEKKF